VLYIALMAARMDVAAAEDASEGKKALAGDDVKPPRISEVKDV